MKYIALFLLAFIAPFIITFNYAHKAQQQRILENKRKSSVEYNKPRNIPQVKIHNFNEPLAVGIKRDELIDPFLDSINLINKERLPFDEPINEVGQQDGALRSKWKDAYFTKKSKYLFNEDTYYVFGNRKDNNKLYARLPQVCSDFLVDSIERGLGNWYYPSKRRPHYIRGEFSIRKQAKVEGYNLRRLRELVKFMHKHPEDYNFIFEGKGLAIGDSTLLKRWFQSVINVEVGDMVLISGRVPWDNKQHSHSFIITKMEDGYIKRISGNAGIAREWRLSRESRRTPLRTVRYVIRLKDNLLLKMK